MGRHRRNDDDEGYTGELFETKDEVPDRTFERDSAPVQGFEYFGADTRDQEDDQ